MQYALKLLVTPKAKAEGYGEVKIILRRRLIKFIKKYYYLLVISITNSTLNFDVVVSALSGADEEIFTKIFTQLWDETWEKWM